MTATALTAPDAWAALADDLWHGRTDEHRVLLALMGARPDLPPWQLWDLWEDLEEAVTLARDVADGNVTFREMGMANADELGGQVDVRLRDAVNALIGGRL